MKLKAGHWYVTRDGQTTTQVRRRSDMGIYDKHEFEDILGHWWTVRGEWKIGEKNPLDLVAEVEPPRRVRKRPKKGWVLYGESAEFKDDGVITRTWTVYRTPKGKLKSIEDDVGGTDKHDDHDCL